MSPQKHSDDWNEYKRLVMSELDRLNTCFEKLRVSQNSLESDINKILTTNKIINVDNKNKVAIWTTIITVTGALITSIISLIMSMNK